MNKTLSAIKSLSLTLKPVRLCVCSSRTCLGLRPRLRSASWTTQDAPWTLCCLQESRAGRKCQIWSMMSARGTAVDDTDRYGLQLCYGPLMRPLVRC